MSDSGSGSGSNGNQVGSPNPPPAQGPSPLPPPPAAPPPPAYPQQPPQYGAPPQTPYPVPPQQQQPPYQPPQYAQYPQQQPQYAAPVYAPQQPQQQGYQQPMMQQPGFAPPPAKGGSRTLLIVGIAAAFLIVLLAVGGILANASFSSTYSAGKAVQAYFAAQSRGDANYMVGNANYLKGDSGTDAFFGKDAVTAMVKQKENKAVSGVSVSSTQSLDSSTSKVTVALSWNGNAVTETYTVHKDTSRTHFVFYNDWKLDIPAEQVGVTVPNQAGSLTVDGIAMPSGVTSVAVIQGYHTVTMGATDLYDEANLSANAIDGNASVTFPGTLGAAAAKAAAAALHTAFTDNSWCDVNAHAYCPGHLYHPDAGTYEKFTLPNGTVVNAYSSWIYTYTGDPSANAKLTVGTTTDEVQASGTCTEKLVLDGKSTVNLAGTWTGTLTLSNGDFGYDILLNCRSSVV